MDGELQVYNLSILRDDPSKPYLKRNGAANRRLSGKGQLLCVSSSWKGQMRVERVTLPNKKAYLYHITPSVLIMFKTYP
jgi:hypothetical protein